MRIDVLPIFGKQTDNQLQDTTVIVVDVLRATSSIICALNGGAIKVVPTVDAGDAVELAGRLGARECVLGGERGGIRINGFDLGNSPKEYLSRTVRNKTVIVSTTNGTEALHSVKSADRILLGAMINRMAALILPSVASTMGLFLMRQSMSTVPDAMIEAAKVDGASLFTICWRIVIPNQKPALMTMAIFAFQGAWNITGGSVVYDEALKTLPTVILQAASGGIARQGVTMAAGVILFVPSVLFFILAQSQVMETMAHSGIKD